MKLLILILNKVEKLEEILEGFIDIGISGATIIDSIGMGHVLSEECLYLPDLDLCLLEPGLTIKLSFL